MNREHLEKAKSLLKELKDSEVSSGLLKRAAVVAVVLGFVRSSAGLADGHDVSKLVKALGPQDQKPMTGTPWSDWADWKDWKDWSDWTDWTNWSDWRDWTNWSDWKDWRDWTNWSDWKDWADIVIPAKN